MSRPWRTRLLLSVATASLFLSLVEAAGRLLPHPRTRAQPTGQAGVDLPHDPGVSLVATAADGTRRFMRGGNTFHAMSWRMPRPARTYRIVAVGDSTVFGLFPLALGLGLSLPDRDVEVLNFGVRAIASDRVR